MKEELERLEPIGTFESQRSDNKSTADTSVPITAWDGRLLGGDEGRIIIGVLTDAWDVLHVLNFIVGAYDEYGAREHTIERTAGDQNTIVFAKGGVAVIASGDDFIGVCGAAPAFLCERQVHTDADHIHVGQFTCLLVESLCFEIAHRRVERGYRCNNARLPGAAGQRVVAHQRSFVP